jgi:tRNA1Val (adenine37-N6)-methyltransferase
MVALEIQGSLVDLARRNEVLNGLGDGQVESDVADGGRKERVEVVRGDIREVNKLFKPESFDLVVSNPPYRAIGRGRTGPSEGKTIARHERECSLRDLIPAAAYLLKPKGIFAFCHLGERWAEIAETLSAHDFAVIRREEEGTVVLIEAVAP